jgi:hypothetical protein
MHSAPVRPRSRYCYVLLLAGLALLPATATYGGFYVDDYEIGEVGSCNLDNFVSFASNHDFMAVTSPSCVVRIGVPVEIGTEVQRSRESEEIQCRRQRQGDAVADDQPCRHRLVR